ncbi:Zinc finger domain-containing C2H2 [Cordyceps militaris]|uniref:Zinc finger domain-containing C2H2 n=1 Tax=Cordyceps militaris TaxID=73501 RepID=A0A2H4S6C6_CORMI|nr:Zinc finger domain-containing C2H2 [Cordyceps militaris]
MTAVQKHQSRQQAVSLCLESTAYRKSPSTSSSLSHYHEHSNSKFHPTSSAVLGSQPSGYSQERVPRAFLSSKNEAMSAPLTGNNQLPAIQPNSGFMRHSNHRQTVTTSHGATFSGVGRRTPPAPLEGRHRHGSTSSGDPSLQYLAVDALQAVRPPRERNMSLPQLTNDISISTRKLSLRDDHLPSLSTLSRGASAVKFSIKSETRSPPPLLTPASGELPPLQMDSARPEKLGQSLPSIRSTFGDINRIPPIEKDTPISPHQIPKCPASPPGATPRLPPISATHTSPPISPNDTYHRNLPSPHSITSSGGSYGYPPASLHRSSSYDISRAGSDADTAHSPSTQSHMSIDGIASGPIGCYVCTFDGCGAHPFQTQYLLNSHANVHSSARPHYCPVQGCPRSEGGKGFKRKNEMIRHGLVHDSPGYVCPFCPDREHKYPRPDNLQRHVRVHHLDRDKDDPLLREVLSQRPDGPNRGRRRRGPAI